MLAEGNPLPCMTDSVTPMGAIAGLEPFNDLKP